MNSPRCVQVAHLGLTTMKSSNKAVPPATCVSSCFFFSGPSGLQLFRPDSSKDVLEFDAYADIRFLDSDLLSLAVSDFIMVAIVAEDGTKSILKTPSSPKIDRSEQKLKYRKDNSIIPGYVDILNLRVGLCTHEPTYVRYKDDAKKQSCTHARAHTNMNIAK